MIGIEWALWGRVGAQIKWAVLDLAFGVRKVLSVMWPPLPRLSTSATFLFQLKTPPWLQNLDSMKLTEFRSFGPVIRSSPSENFTRHENISTPLPSNACTWLLSPLCSLLSLHCWLFYMPLPTLKHLFELHELLCRIFSIDSIAFWAFTGLERNFL